MEKALHEEGDLSKAHHLGEDRAYGEAEDNKKLSQLLKQLTALSTAS